MVRKGRDAGCRESLLEFPTRAGGCLVGTFTEAGCSRSGGKAVDSVMCVRCFRSTSSGETSRGQLEVSGAQQEVEEFIGTSVGRQWKLEGR